MQADQQKVKLIERVRIVKTNMDCPEQPPEILEQETVSEISIDQASLLGFFPGQGFNPLPPYSDTYTVSEANQAWSVLSADADGPPPPTEGEKVGD